MLAAMPAAALDLRRLSPVLGAELAEVQLLDSDEAVIGAVWSALDRHALLLVREQRLSPEDLIALTRRFGEPEQFPESRAVRELPEVCIVTNDLRAAPNQPVYWHTDGALQPEPASLSLFYAVRTPSSGGETLFADAREAYDSLPGGLRERIEGRRTVLPSGLEQPLVRRHPRTGRRALYADFGRTVGITGLDRDAARTLLKDLRAHVARPAATYAHKWTLGDLAIWDNASILHSATKPPPADELRIMWRTSVRGGAVVAA
jgi:taurine dioxygenase